MRIEGGERVGTRAAGFGDGSGEAETIFANGRILTGDGLVAGWFGAAARQGGERDSGLLQPAVVTHLAVRDGRVVAAGDEAATRGWRGAKTEVVDLQGAFAMPGFNDAHVHLGLLGQRRLALDLCGEETLGQMVHAVGQYGRTVGEGEWILGGGWDETRWPEGRLPTRDDLDCVTGGRPTVLWRTDVHLAVANTAALERAGVRRGAAQPVGGWIDQDGEGRPTGVLREAAAMGLVDAVVPPLTTAQRRRGMQRALQEVAEYGVTSVQDNSDWEDFPVLAAMRQGGELPVRVAEWMDFNRPVEELEERRRGWVPDDWLQVTQLKGFLDGSLGSRTAWMLEPYADDAGNVGLPRYEQAELLEMARERVMRGFSLAFHAIGDRANRMALDVLETAMRGGAPGLRCRVEHAQVVAPEEVKRFGQAGVIASMQPCHLLSDLGWAGARLGARRARGAYAWRSLAEAGAVLAFGTDIPVEPVDPMRGLWSAVSRRGVGEGEAWGPEERLSMGEALWAYTQGSAYAEFREVSKGRLRPGYMADMAVLSRDLLAAAPEEVLGTRVVRTVVGGRTIFEAQR